jgi:2-hydroxychromene-2-carboxylate isomerase
MVIMKGKNGSVKLRLPLVAAFVAAFVVAPAFAVPTGLLKAKTASKVPVEVFLMSKCSYCVDVLMSVRPLLDTYGSAIDYRQAFIAKETSPGTFQSMHGDGEVQGDLAMLCMERYYKKDYGYMDAVLCMIDDEANIPGNWKGCAEKNGMDPSKLEPCIIGDEGRQLLSQSVKRSQEAGATGAPTLLIAGTLYSGPRKTANVETAVCCAFKKGSRPKACPADLVCPTNLPVNLVVLTDKRCEKCPAQVETMLKTLKQKIAKLKVNEVDYKTPKGKKLYKKSGIKFLPAFLFSKNFKTTATYAQVEKWLAPVGDYLVMEKGSTFDPTVEICDNQVDDDKNGSIDCQDDGCRQQLACREAKPGSIDFFVMSQCPYAAKAMDSVKELLERFKGALAFGLHYVVSVYAHDDYAKLPSFSQSSCTPKDDGFYYCSLHGSAEVEEDLRQLCAIKHGTEGGKYLDYILCRNENVKSPDWKPCAAKAGLDKAKIETCSTTQEGLDLFKAEAALAKDLGITASPTFLINNNEIISISDRSAIGFASQVCSKNPGLSGCSP